MELELPEILNIPPKLLPLITQFNNYEYFVIEGGRASAKTQSVGRILLYIAEHRQVRIGCGREIQDTIEDSVHAVLSDLIKEHSLAFDITKKSITHHISKSDFGFKGFRERGAVNLKGWEGIDILWPDEAQTMTKDTLDIILPTIRKNKSKIIFTMNRYMRDDAVIEALVGRPDCLHIKINYYDNPHCTLKIKNEAEILKNKNYKEYKHIYLGEPLAQADDYLFNFDKLHKAFEINPSGEVFGRQRALGIDFAAQGNDQCVAIILDRISAQHWKVVERIVWDEPDTMISVGKIVAIIGEFKPTVTALDVGGLGKPVYDRLIEVGMKIQAFDGGTTDGVDTDTYANLRAHSYFDLREWFDQGFLIMEKKEMDLVKQLEKIKFKYRSNGVKLIQAKMDMKKEMGYSPDDADALNMAVWVAKHFLGKPDSQTLIAGHTVKRIHGSKRKH